MDSIGKEIEMNKFRFQTGSIKRRDFGDANVHITGFDSKLVRLKAGCRSRLRDTDKGFDSKLVRLKAAVPFASLDPFSEVSIPNWFD